jgi:iron complex transport system ATP-binding protein
MLTVREVIALSLYARRPGLFGLGRDDESRVDDAIDRLAIRSIEERPYPQLSGGQQRLVLLARALATGSKTILLDEPTASLDLKYSLRLFDILEDLRRDGYCLVVVLHDLDDVCRHCQNALLIDTGRERFLGVPREAAFLKHTAATYEVSLVEADRIGFRLPNAASKSPTPSTPKSPQ